MFTVTAVGAGAAEDGLGGSMTRKGGVGDGGIDWSGAGY